jgi:hypothetical protein
MASNTTAFKSGPMACRWVKGGTDDRLVAEWYNQPDSRCSYSLRAGYPAVAQVYEFPQSVLQRQEHEILAANLGISHTHARELMELMREQRGLQPLADYWLHEAHSSY